MPDPPTIADRLQLICESVTKEALDLGNEAPDCRVLIEAGQDRTIHPNARFPFAAIDTAYTHVTISHWEGENAWRADFKYEDPTLGDVREMVFDGTSGGEWEVGFAIQEQIA